LPFVEAEGPCNDGSFGELGGDDFRGGSSAAPGKREGPPAGATGDSEEGALESSKPGVTAEEPGLTADVGGQFSGTRVAGAGAT
jgi:hypothetical protein